MNLPDLEPFFSKPELAYLQAKNVQPKAERARGVVDDGRSDCDSLAAADTKEGRIDTLLNEKLDRKAIQHLCPEYRADLELAKYAFADGNYSVPREVAPGTYHTFGPTSDCYWERGTRRGDTIENRFVTNAPDGVVVTIRASDGAFKSEGCDIWVRK